MIEKDPSRLAVLTKIEEFERAGIFDQDCEDDPPTKPILPGTVDYKQKKLSSKLAAKAAFKAAHKFADSLLEKGDLVMEEIQGIENLDGLTSGAIVTCNHFSPMDSFAIQLVYEKSKVAKKRKFFRVIREGNYTSFPGFYGMLMRSCNTLPLASDMRVMKEFLEGVHYQLEKGNLVLVYPEQSLWWNYRKPKPLKRGAFSFAVSSMVPVVPVFICMKDTDKIGEDGFPVQAYYPVVGKPIYPDPSKSGPQNIACMMEENAKFWKETYESFYGVPLTYLCDEK